MRPHPFTCACKGSGWVCEDHPYRPFGDYRTCPCEAPGAPCPGIDNVTPIRKDAA